MAGHLLTIRSVTQCDEPAVAVERFRVPVSIDRFVAPVQRCAPDNQH